MNNQLEQQLIKLFCQLTRQIVLEELSIQKNGTNDASSFITISSFSSIFGWVLGEDKLYKLFIELISRGFIACPFEEFKLHFLGTSTRLTKLVWLSSSKNLLYIFHKLILIDALPKKENFHSVLCEHFVDKRNKSLNRNSLKSLFYKVQNNSFNKDLDLIFNSLK